MVKKVLATTVAIYMMVVGSASAVVLQVDLSPAPGLALNSTNYALGDHTLGISALNAVGQPASSATGDEIGSGITFDTVTKLLSFDIGYGSDHGLIDLLGNFSAAHIHGPVAVQFPSPNIGAPILIGLPHTVGSSTQTGKFTGSTALIAADETSLLNNLLYVNIHSSFAAGGEIRGQLVPVVPEPSTIILAAIGLVGLAAFGWRRRKR